MSVLLEPLNQAVRPVRRHATQPSNAAPEAVTNNLLLAGLPSFGRYREHLERVVLPSQSLPIEAGRSTRYAYFPETGVLAESVLLRDGSAVAINLVGHEGVADLAACLGAGTVPLQVTTLVGGSVLRMPAATFVGLAQDDGSMLERLHLYGQILLMVRAYAVACSRLHPVQSRLVRLLLRIHEQVNGGEFFLTHDSIAQLLGVSRPSVTVNATALHRQGLIVYRRGMIRILDRAGLEAIACECHWFIDGEFGHLTGHARWDAASRD